VAAPKRHVRSCYREAVTRFAALWLAALVGCAEPAAPSPASATEDTPTTVPTTATADVAPPVETPAAAIPDPPEPPASEPPRATAPTTDELLVIDTVGCYANSAQALVDCKPHWQGLLRSPAAPAWQPCSLDNAAVEAHAPVTNELWRGSFGSERVSESRSERRCTITKVEAREPASKHNIQALTNDLLANIPMGADVDVLGIRAQLESVSGPVRAVIGQNSSRIRFAAVYLDDLGPLLAIPTHELLTRDDLRTWLDAAFAAKWRGDWVRSGRNFAPQVQDAKLRHAWGYTPIFQLCPSDWPYVCAFAVPVQDGQRRRYLIMAATQMRSPDEHALTRRLLIERIVEDGLTPTPEAIAYAAAH
jgi:hypothetical protein